MTASRARSNMVLIGLVLSAALTGLYLLSGRPRSAVTYLALGDSYTVGTGGLYRSNYANQSVQLLRKQHIDIDAPVVIAGAGWTTTALAESIRRKNIKDTFSFVSLCIGTNNQFYHLGIDKYRVEFEQLLRTAISYTNGHPDRVIVMSLPDWSRTAFATRNNRQNNAQDLEAYNAVCKEITNKYQCQYLDITTLSREIANKPQYYAPDGLHPSADGHALWAEKLVQTMNGSIPRLIARQ